MKILCDNRELSEVYEEAKQQGLSQTFDHGLNVGINMAMAWAYCALFGIEHFPSEKRCLLENK